MVRATASQDGEEQIINLGEDDQMDVFGYRKRGIRTTVTWVFIVLTIGFLRLVFYWLPHFMIRATHSRCSLASAETVILKDIYDQFFVSSVQTAEDFNTSNDTGPKSAVTRLTAKGNASTSLADRSDLKDDLHDGPRHMRFFISKKVKYIWDVESEKFTSVTGLEDGKTCSYFYQCQGLEKAEQAKREAMFGHNSIRIHVTPILTLLYKEVLSPFYIFQVFSCCVWYAEDYQYYASCIVVISFVSISATIYQTRKMQRALRNTISSSSTVNVRRGKSEAYEEISSEELVPGDVIEVPKNGCIMQCDAVLISGSCIVNESMLTGESVPITKTPLPNPKKTREDSALYFNIKDHGRHVLFSGTHVIQTRFNGGQKVSAVVFRTGFSTSKGALVRTILYPKPVDFKFNRDAYRFVGVLAFIALIGFVFTIVLMTSRGNSASEVVIRALDLLTIAVPPALPAALTVGIVFAQARMKEKQIYCISPRSINVCGSINTVCFDKTGTLTEDGLDMQVIVPVSQGRFEREIQDIQTLGDGMFKMGMATCHSLALIDGALCGDPLELIMFEALQWELEEVGPETRKYDTAFSAVVRAKQNVYGKTPVEVGIVRQFTFSSSLQRMSVIAKEIGTDNYTVFTKGAPEMIVSLCLEDTIPDDFMELLKTYTQHGYRVLAMACKQLPVKVDQSKVQQLQRDQVEKNLTFLGLLVMENKLKPETTPVINQLRDANIRTIMVTGDNLLTALSVARECQMVDLLDPVILVEATPPQTDELGNIVSKASIEYLHTANLDKDASEKGSVSLTLFDLPVTYHFAMTGKSWAVLRQHFPDVIDKIVVKAKVFARMSPDQKAQLVEVLQDMGYYVGMCGDGANDCGALKTAHAGISLSEAEASVASAFTSKNPNISCIPAVISEGRAALVTSFGIFKFMACYSLTQFVSVLLLYWVSLNLMDFQFLYIDLFLVTTLSITFGRTGAYDKLSKDPPSVNLISLVPVLSLILQMTLMISVQVFFFMTIQNTSWFIPRVDDPNIEKDWVCYENTAVFVCSTYQYIILAVIFSKGHPYRQSMFTNYWYIGNLVLCIGFSVWLNVYPPTGLATFIGVQPPPSMNFRLMFIGVAVINLMTSLILETHILDSHLLSVTCQGKLARCLPGGIPQHTLIEEEIQGDHTWPDAKPYAPGVPGTYMRLNSKFQTSSPDRTEDDHSLLESDSDTQSLHINDAGPVHYTEEMSLSMNNGVEKASGGSRYANNESRSINHITTTQF